MKKQWLVNKHKMEKIKKLAQQKMIQQQFKKQAKEDSIRGEIEKAKSNEERDKKIEHEEKRLRVMCK